MTNSWMNEDGEPIMDGAAWRFEQQLDLDSQDDYMADRFYDNDGEPDCTEDPEDDCHDGWSWNAAGVAECEWCGLELPQHEPDGAPSEQWEVTTPPEVYMTDDEPDWNPWP